MTALLISRGSMAGGEMVAQELERAAGFRCVTREDLLATVNAHGEIATRVTASIAGALHAYEQFSRLRRPYKALMRQALLERTRAGDVAYLGYSGHLLVPLGLPFPRVRLEASIELRARLTVERLHLAADEAREYIRRMDDERVRWGRFLYGCDIRDARAYDLVVTMDRLSPATVCGLLVDLARRSEFRPSPEAQQSLADLVVATDVEVALAVHPEVGEYELGARSLRGKVTLEGPYLEEPELGRVLDVARAVPGVTAVEFHPGYAPTLDCCL